MMTDEQVRSAKDRAADVVNGFKRVTDRAARDVMKLAETIEEKNRQIDALKRRLLADNLMNAGKAWRTTNPMGDFFRSIGL